MTTEILTPARVQANPHLDNDLTWTRKRINPPTRALITGGAGFGGHHLVEHLLKETGWDIVVLDRLNYAANGLDRLRDIDCFTTERVDVLTADFTNPLSMGVIKEIGKPDYIIHMGAETHVDNSITNPLPFVMSNVLGTMHMLDYAISLDSLKQFVYFSTDEVFGSAPEGVNYKEWDRYDSGNAYAATKAGGEELALAYANTHGLPTLITHTMNLFGERQHPEKFIPKTINNILSGKGVDVHASADLKTTASRYWIHCRNMADALLFILNSGVIQRDKINIVGEKEVDGETLVKFISGIVGGQMKWRPVDFHSSRPGHDMRYALDGGKLAGMGWEPPMGFWSSLEKTIQWTLDHPRWLEW